LLKVGAEHSHCAKLIEDNDGIADRRRPPRSLKLSGAIANAPHLAQKRAAGREEHWRALGKKQPNAPL
jgi:hypothetical protein